MPTADLAILCRTVVDLALIGAGMYLARACGWKITATTPKRAAPPPEPAAETAGLEIVAGRERAS